VKRVDFTIATTIRRTHRQPPLVEFAPVLKRLVFRFILPAIVGALLGFFALAFAVQNEPSIPAPLLCLLSPGLKIAEMVTPARHESLGSAFGGFLRVAIGVNAAFYFAIFALAAYLVDRRRSR
jgi:hypothetical protein